MIGILGIGNSYSQDAQKWLHQVCASVGEEVEAVRLYIGSPDLVRNPRPFDGFWKGEYYGQHFYEIPRRQSQGADPELR